MGVALENARLFDETQRLLKETEQRAAELAVINSIQQGMAAELDFQAIVDLVGDKLREVFAHRRHRHPLVRRRQRSVVHYLYDVRARRAPARCRRAAPRAGRRGASASQAARPLVANSPAPRCGARDRRRCRAPT